MEHWSVECSVHGSFICLMMLLVMEDCTHCDVLLLSWTDLVQLMHRAAAIGL